MGLSLKSPQNETVDACMNTVSKYKINVQLKCKQLSHRKVLLVLIVKTEYYKIHLEHEMNGFVWANQLLNEVHSKFDV